MSYKINPFQNLQFELHRIMNEKSGQADALLKDVSVSPDDKAHDFRTTIKKLRAALKLMRYNLGEDVYRSENNFYRELQNEFSMLRDSYVRRATLESLMPGASEKLNLRLFDTFYADLDNRYRQIKKEFMEDDKIAGVIKSLEEHAAKISLLTLDDNNPEQAVHGIKKIYKQAQKAMAKALDESTAQNMHEWRKKTKYFWYEVKMLRHIWPRLMKSLEKEIHHLSDLLGDEHDLSVLIESLEDKKYQGDSMVHSVKSFALAQKEELKSKSFSLGAKVFDESPGRFSGRIKTYWVTTVGEETF